MSARASGAPICAVLVEDNPGDARLIVELLRDGGAARVDVETFGRLAPALARLERADVDVVLLDLGLPCGEGVETFERARRSAPMTPIVVVSGLDDEHSAIAAVRAGAQDYLVKGRFDGPVLHRAIRYAIERHRLERALAEAAEFSRQVIASAVEGIVVLDREQRYRLWNPFMEKLSGIAQHSVLGRRPREVFPRLVAQGLEAHLERALAGETVRVPDLREESKGGEVWTSGALAPLRDAAGAVTGVIGSVVDITARKRAELALAESEARFRLQADALNAAANAIFITDRDGTIMWVNRAWETLTGYSAAETIGAKPSILKSGAQGDAFYAALWRTILAGEVWRGELVNRRRDGTPYTEEQTITPVLDQAGRVAHFIGVKQDVSERKLAASKLAESQGRLRLAVTSGKVGLWEWDIPSGRVTLSPEWKRQIGYEPDELADSVEAWVSRLHPEERAGVLRGAEDYLRGDASDYECEFRLRHKDGSYRHILARASAVHDAAGRRVRVLGSSVDITERALLQAQLLQSQKMESVGRLAGGVAHDFNNLLTVILNTAELAVAELHAETPLRRDFDQIRDAAQRAAALTRQLLAFSRKQVMIPEVLDLNAVIAGMWDMLRRLIGEDLEMVFVPGNALGNVRADRGQLEQVVVNLAVNARDAMPGGGTLTVETRDVEVNGEFGADHSAVKPGPHVMLLVSDTGQGMDEHTRTRIFEPFFTTKAPGQGTGLGLSTVYGIVKQSGGGILVASEIGKGTTFRIFLPRVEKAAPETRPGRATPARGSETILVVEDEEVLRGVAARMLGRSGYAVLTCANAAEALALLETRAGQVRLMLTDVVMPGMSGLELGVLVAERYPAIRIVYTSGYTETAAPQSGAVPGAAGFIGKPYTGAELTRRIRQALDD